MTAAQPGSAVTPRHLGGDPLRGVPGFLTTLRCCLLGLLLLAALFGGPVGVVGAVFIGLAALIAERVGFVAALAQYVGLALGAALAWWLVVPPALYISLSTDISPLITLIGGFAIFAAFLAWLAGRSVRFVLQRSRLHRRRYLALRVGGLFLGGFAGTAATVVFCWCLALVGPAIMMRATATAPAGGWQAAFFSRLDHVRAAFHEDPLARAIEEHDLLRHSTRVMTLRAALELGLEPGVYWQASEQGLLDDLVSIPCVAFHYDRISEDPDMRAAVKRRDLAAILNSRYFSDALADDEFCAAVAAHWDALRTSISEAHVARVRAAAANLDVAARTKYETALRRAVEYGVDLP